MKIDDPEWWNDIDAKLSKDEFFEIYDAIVEHARVSERLADNLTLALDDGKVEIEETKSVTERLLKTYKLLGHIKTLLSDI
ncbi:MAG: hypothetical protein LBH85_03610 [Treponema sp.]|jgi:hypothetical protein|nr:hypothetical protein [Treponema sp.]